MRFHERADAFTVALDPGNSETMGETSSGAGASIGQHMLYGQDAGRKLQILPAHFFFFRPEIIRSIWGSSGAPQYKKSREPKA